MKICKSILLGISTKYHLEVYDMWYIRNINNIRLQGKEVLSKNYDS